MIRAALERDPAPAFEALQMDPLSPPDEGRCRKMFDELMAEQADVLPFRADARRPGASKPIRVVALSRGPPRNDIR